MLFIFSTINICWTPWRQRQWQQIILTKFWHVLIFFWLWPNVQLILSGLTISHHIKKSIGTATRFMPPILSPYSWYSIKLDCFLSTDINYWTVKRTSCIINQLSPNNSIPADCQYVLINKSFHTSNDHLGLGSKLRPTLLFKWFHKRLAPICSEGSNRMFFDWMTEKELVQPW